MIEYIDVVYPDCWGDERVTDSEHEAACARATAWLSEHEGAALSITMRPGRVGRHAECAGLYRVGMDGDLHTTRYEEDDELRGELLDGAYQHALDTWVSDALAAVQS